MNHKEETLSSKQIYQGRILSVYDDTVLLENGHEAKREWVDHNGGVCILALDANGCTYLVRQYRYPYHQEILELPAGKRDSKNEAPIDCAKRELEEEVGLQANNWTFLGEVYPTPGYCAEILYLYLATDQNKTLAHPDEDEFLDVLRLPFDSVLAKVLSGEIKDAKTCVAVLKTAQMYPKKD